MKAEPGKDVEDEEDLLYGETGSKFKMQSMIDMTISSQAQKSDWWRRLIQYIKPSFWLFVARDNGNLEVYSVPDLKLMYLVTDVANGNKILVDAMEYVSMPKDEDHFDTVSTNCPLVSFHQFIQLSLINQTISSDRKSLSLVLATMDLAL